MFRYSLTSTSSSCFRLHKVSIRMNSRNVFSVKGLRKTGQNGPLWESPDWSYLDGTQGPISDGQRTRNYKADIITKLAHTFLTEMEESKRLIRDNPNIGKKKKIDYTIY